MSLFRRFFYKKPPDRLLEIFQRTYVFDCCFSNNVLYEDEYKIYLGGIVAQLLDYHPDASFMVFNFREGTKRSEISDILSDYDMTVMDYPQYEGCPLLPLEMINHSLRSCESWLTLEGQQNVLLMHCERGGWPVFAFMLAGLLLYKKLYNGEQKTLKMVYKLAPRQLLHQLSLLNPLPSQLRYLQYISGRNTSSDWPPSDSPLSLDYIILRVLPLFDGGRGCRPVVHVYGQDPTSTTSNRHPKLLFSTLKTKEHSRLYQQEECAVVKMDIHQIVQGDVVLECVHLETDFMVEEMIFRVMFHTAFIRSNILMLNRDEVDVLWDAKDLFHRGFRAEVFFSNVDPVPPIITMEMESENDTETKSASPKEMLTAKEIFNAILAEALLPLAPPQSSQNAILRSKAPLCVPSTYFRAVPPIITMEMESEDETETKSASPKEMSTTEEIWNAIFAEVLLPSPSPPPPSSQNAILSSKAPPPPPPPLALPPPRYLPSTYSRAAVASSSNPPPPPPPPPPTYTRTAVASIPKPPPPPPPPPPTYTRTAVASIPKPPTPPPPPPPTYTQTAVVACNPTPPPPLLSSGSAPPVITMELESEDNTETKSATPQEILEVEDIFTNAVDAKVHDVVHISSHRISLAGSPDIGEMVVSLTDQEEAIICRLMRGSSQRDIVSIVGMAGIGKTTLAKKVYNDPKIAYHFHRRAWCSVSQVYGKRELLLDIIKDVHGLPDEIHQMTDADLELHLRRKLKEIRYLVVMDDVWDIEAFNDLERSFPDDGEGSRILITSRFHNVALKAKPDSNPHMLRPLSDDESWKLLEMKSFAKVGSCHKELVEIGKEIARQCEGLPLAVVSIAGILKRTENKQDHWENIAKSLSSQIIADPETRCKFILELSYMHLPCHLKACFLYFGAFSEDKEVPVSKLIRLWIAEGFIENNEAKCLEDTAEDYLMDLINGSLVMISKRRSNGRVKACCVHGLLRDLCLSKAREGNFLQLITRYNEPYASFDLWDYGSDFYDFYPSNPVTYECQRLCIHLKRKHFVYSRPSGPCTSSLIFSACSDTYPRRPYNVSFICHHFKLLKVLDLECINMGTCFPPEIELLVQLRYLAVSGDMESIPTSIANLVLLETFIVKGLSGKVLLPNTIWCMTNLRHLHVNSYAVFNLQDEKIESSFQLDNLVSLSLPSLSYGKDAEKILRRLPNLQKLICVFLESWDSTMNCNQFPRLDCLTKLESLQMVYFGRALNPAGFTFPLNLKKLTLSNFRLPWNHTCAIGRLPNLEVLKLLFGAFEGLMWEMREDEFCKLKFLKLDTLNIVQWNASYEHLPELQQLVLRNCKNLEEVPIDFAGIPTLQKIEVQGCKRSVEVSVQKIEEETEEIKVIIT